MKKWSKKKNQLNSDMVLQITSMADIFTILLVFLLKSFSTGVTTITPTSVMILPEAKQPSPIEETLKIEISESSISMDDKPILPLTAYLIASDQLDQYGMPKSLNAALTEQRNKDSLQQFPKMLILADEKTPYATIKRVLASASTSGFVNYKLVVVEDQ
jgi:biopolymer transport protein ExbD